MYLGQTVEAGPADAVFRPPGLPTPAACSTPSPNPRWAHGVSPRCRGKCLRPSIPRQLCLRN